MRDQQAGDIDGITDKARQNNYNPRATLSGLLNIIDGVASIEGRILIMTTNFPDKLDMALTRPGRADLQIGFTMATTPQIRRLFLSIYATDFPESSTTVVSDAALSQMAVDFADRIPSSTFTPAAIQGYLLSYKKTPQLALDMIEKWVKENMRK